MEFSAIETSIRNLCSDILVELYRIIDLGVPTGFRDLFLEQGMYSTALYFCNTQHNIPLNICVLFEFLSSVTEINFGLICLIV